MAMALHVAGFYFQYSQLDGPGRQKEKDLDHQPLGRRSSLFGYCLFPGGTHLLYLAYCLSKQPDGQHQYRQQLIVCFTLLVNASVQPKHLQKRAQV